MIKCENCLELHKLIAAEERISELERELDSLKPGTIKTMKMCECGRHYHLPSDKCCDKCMIDELEAELADAKDWSKAGKESAAIASGEISRLKAQLAERTAESKQLDHETRRQADLILAFDRRIAELEAENAKQAEAVDGWIHSVADLKFSLKNLNAQLAEHEKYASVLDSCTELLEKHWPASMSCNGRLCVDGHLQNILNVLAEHEWVSVEDRLPEVSGWYAIFNGIEWFRCYYANPNNWVKDFVNIKAITHWKPIHLPEAKPEKGSE